MRRLNNIIFKIRLFFADDYSKAALYSKYLNINFGQNVRIIGKPYFGSEPYLISIGNDVTITYGAIFQNHDGGVGVLRNKYPGIDVIKPIKVGNNVFIGSRVTILPGIIIGNNVVIGSGSLLTRDIPDNVVVAGVPARILKTLAEYEEKVLREAIYLKNRDDENIKKNELLNILNLK
jgi:acetyltransferase-like isoleucine patch superfamily enzyme